MKGCSLATPTLGGYVHYLCFKCHPQLLASRSKCFAQGRTSSGVFSVSFIGAHQLHLSSWRRVPIDKRNGHWRNLRRWPPESGSVCCETTIECHAALDVQTIQRPPEQFSRKVLRNLIFTVRDKSVKTVKIMRLKNLALYSIFVSLWKCHSVKHFTLLLQYFWYLCVGNLRCTALRSLYEYKT